MVEPVVEQPWFSTVPDTITVWCPRPAGWSARLVPPPVGERPAVVVRINAGETATGQGASRIEDFPVPDIPVTKTRATAERYRVGTAGQPWSMTRVATGCIGVHEAKRPAPKGTGRSVSATIQRQLWR